MIVVGKKRRQMQRRSLEPADSNVLKDRLGLWPRCWVIRLLLNLEAGIDPNRLRDIEVVWRCLHHCLVNLAKLFDAAIALDTHDVLNGLVTRAYRFVDSQKPAEVELAPG